VRCEIKVRIQLYAFETVPFIPTGQVLPPHRLPRRPLRLREDAVSYVLGREARV